MTKYYRHAAGVAVLLKRNYTAPLKLNEILIAHFYHRHPFSAFALQRCDL